MNLKLTISFLLSAVFVSLLIACGGGTQIADTPSPEAKVLAKADVEPSPTNESPKPEPTNAPVPKPSPTKAPATATATTKATESASTPTEVPPTATPTPTYTATPTSIPTSVPPTATATPTPTSIPTSVPPTATATPTPTPTPTQVPPTATPIPSTQVGGRLTADTVWTIDQSPYRIIDTLQIPVDITLTIEEGVTIKADTDIGDSFLVLGILVAEGTTENPITFDANGSNLFNVESATNAMFVSLTHAVLKNGQSIFPQWDEAPSGVVHVSNSTITNMTGLSWFWPHPTGIVVSSNVFHNSAGFVLFKSDNISIFNNKFVSKEGSDSWLLILFSPEGTRIERNSFLDEGIAVDVMTIVVSSGSNVSLSEFNLSNNYWGTINPEQIAAKILDANDVITLGERVKYEPFLTEPHPDTP